MTPQEPGDEAPPAHNVMSTPIWQLNDDGRQVATGENWKAVVQLSGGGWEGLMTLRGEARVWPDPQTSGRTDAMCRSWVRRCLSTDMDRQRWIAYLGHATRAGRRRGS